MPPGPSGGNKKEKRSRKVQDKGDEQQYREIEAAQYHNRKMGYRDRIESVKKSKQNADHAL